MMTSTTRDTLFDRMHTMRRLLDQMVGAESTASPAWSSGAQRQIWLPALDVYETSQAYIIEGDVPGVRLADIDIRFEQNTLTIKGTRAATLHVPEQAELRVYTAERASGDFARSIRLPEYVDGDRIEASLADGVLRITVPKASAAMPRRITVRTAGEEAKQVSG
jgi:HSP20 family protein